MRTVNQWNRHKTETSHEQQVCSRDHCFPDVWYYSVSDSDTDADLDIDTDTN